MCAQFSLRSRNVVNARLLLQLYACCKVCTHRHTARGRTVFLQRKEKVKSIRNDDLTRRAITTLHNRVYIILNNTYTYNHFIVIRFPSKYYTRNEFDIIFVTYHQQQHLLHITNSRNTGTPPYANIDFFSRSDNNIRSDSPSILAPFFLQ